MNIYLGNLPRSITEDQIREFVSQHGEVTSIKIIMDRITNAPRGFAFVEIPSDDEAKKFIEECNGFMFEGRRLVVSEARKREEGGDRGGRRSFGDRGGNGGNGGNGGGRPFRNNNSGGGGFNRYE